MSQASKTTRFSLLMLWLTPLALTLSCGSINSPRDERHKIEMALHKVRTEVDDLKHDLNSSDIELHILEGKIVDQEDTISTLKHQINQSQASKIEEITQKLSSLAKKISALENSSGELSSDIRKLSSHANETTTALSQYKDKISEMEKVIHDQNKKFDDIAHLKKNIDLLVKEISALEKNHKTYTIKDGDSLQKIARKFSISIDSLKQANQLKNDMIFSGQELVIPNFTSFEE